MTQLNHLSIYNVKSITEMDIDIGSFTIITGRNNSGKTTFLESINLLFNPEGIKEYEENGQKIINAEPEVSQAKIEGTYRKQQQILSDSNSKGDREREVEFREPSEEEVIESVTTLLGEILELNEEYPRRVPMPDDESITREEMGDRIEEIIHDVVGGLSAKRIISSNIGEQLVYVSVGGDMYEYVFLGSGYEDLREDIVSTAFREFQADFEYDSERIEPDRLEHHIKRAFRGMLAPRFGRARFIGESPTDTEEVTFIDSPRASREDLDLDADDAAVRTNRIEKYLKKNEVVENLEDFSFDELVFEGEEGAYSVPYDLMGDGFQTIIGVLWRVLAEDKQGQIILLEEPESNMHPEYATDLVLELLQLCEDRNLQIVLTTHNKDFIDTFFSPVIGPYKRDYLEDNFRLIQMPVESGPALQFNYNEAEDRVNEMGIDLRGF